MYAVKVEKVNLKVFIENTYKDTLTIQKESGKEQIDDFRMKILEQEHKVVQSLKNSADFFLDFDPSSEYYYFNGFIVGISRFS